MATLVQDVTPEQQQPGYVPPTPKLLQVLGRSTGILGLTTIGLGLLVVALGWHGAARIADVREQTPFLLSGGFLGLGLVMLGVGLLITQNARQDRARLEFKLDQILEALRAAGSVAAPGGGTAPDDLKGLVVAGSASYHVPACRLVEGRDDAALLLPVEATARGLIACRVCRPDALSA